MDYAISSIIGKRDNQEDYGVIVGSNSAGGVLAVVADGMGGQVAGEIASSNAVKTFVESFTSNNSKNLPLKLNIAIDKANRAIANSIINNSKLSGMGATLIAAHIDTGGLNWVSVGDSILYLYRDNKLLRLNADHSMMPVLQESVRLGKITREEANNHPHRNALRSALTGEEIPIVELREEPLKLKNDDLILLATDGILTLSETQICQILERCNKHSARSIIDQLLNAVTKQDKPRQDNTLVGVIKVSADRQSFFEWSNFVIFSAMIFLAILLAFSWISRESILKTLGFDPKREQASDIYTQPGDSKITPLILEEPQPTPDKKQNSLPSLDEPKVIVPSPAAESVAKSGKTKSNSKSQPPTTTKPDKTNTTKSEEKPISQNVTPSPAELQLKKPGPLDEASNDKKAETEEARKAFEVLNGIPAKTENQEPQKEK